MDRRSSNRKIRPLVMSMFETSDRDPIVPQAHPSNTRSSRHSSIHNSDELAYIRRKRSMSLPTSSLILPVTVSTTAITERLQGQLSRLTLKLSSGSKRDQNASSSSSSRRLSSKSVQDAAQSAMGLAPDWQLPSNYDCLLDPAKEFTFQPLSTDLASLPRKESRAHHSSEAASEPLSVSYNSAPVLPVTFPTSNTLSNQVCRDTQHSSAISTLRQTSNSYTSSHAYDFKTVSDDHALSSAFKTSDHTLSTDSAPATAGDSIGVSTLTAFSSCPFIQKRSSSHYVRSRSGQDTVMCSTPSNELESRIQLPPLLTAKNRYQPSLTSPASLEKSITGTTEHLSEAASYPGTQHRIRQYEQSLGQCPTLPRSHTPTLGKYPQESFSRSLSPSYQQRQSTYQTSSFQPSSTIHHEDHLFSVAKPPLSLNHAKASMEYTTGLYLAVPNTASRHTQKHQPLLAQEQPVSILQKHNREPSHDSGYGSPSRSHPALSDRGRHLISPLSFTPTLSSTVLEFSRPMKGPSWVHSKRHSGISRNSCHMLQVALGQPELFGSM
ncbi:hypothetical protein BDEG_21061 [Batrachochytrium dendrobatidis JEL423]|uniref:Uncharacterized protein n=1 Tax=Batrachochytrium dendrobatidis (strain JEL423) TaxID=403673 RepID=A0A177WA69_BATDL|nr:hypothetical protein BDEG_21061 [Batrachochytrium dendrobatidis JEL423]